MRNLNKKVILCALLFLLDGCGERWVLNSSGGKAFRFMDSHEGTIVLQVKSMQSGDVIGFADTRASKYHRYSAKWITDNCILFKSSDIGYRAITVNGKCLLYFATVENKDKALRVMLFDEQWESVGIEFDCSAVGVDSSK